jgi:PAS domain S-box-containing protein
VSERPRRILLVEDDPAHARIICRAFKRHDDGIEIAVASSLKEARERLDRASPDLVIIDLLLPDGRGSELIPPDAEELGYPIVILTSHGRQEDAVAALKAGVADYIVKDETTLTTMPKVAERSIREWGHIVERRKAQAALRESELRYRTLAEHAYDLIAEIDEEGHLLFVSPNHLELLGYESQLLVGREWLSLVHPEDRPSARAGLHSLAENGLMSQKPIRFLHSDGSWRWLETTARSYRSDDGQQRAVTTARDVTDRRQLEEQLSQARKLEAVGQLAGGVAHDFNNLLTVIAGYSEYLIDSLDPVDDRSDAAKQIFEAAERSAALTRQLLTFSRKQVIQQKIIDINELVRDLGKMLWRLIGEDVRMVVELDPEIGPLKADSGQIEQAIVNLVVNSRDAMPEGGTLSIVTRDLVVGLEEAESESDLPPGRYVRLRVEDTGKGMDEETQARIFEPFFTTKAEGRGTGLGLSTVYGIVRQSEGVIRVRSQPGCGTAIEIDLPCTDQQGDSISVPEAGSRVEGRTPEEATILLVEDEASVRALLRRTLGEVGYQVIEAEDGEQALRLVEGSEAHIDLLLTDVVMPGMSGVNLCETLRVAHPHLKVLLTSGHTSQDQRLPADSEFIRKPFRPTELVGAIRRILAS